MASQTDQRHSPARWSRTLSKGALALWLAASPVLPGASPAVAGLCASVGSRMARPRPVTGTQRALVIFARFADEDTGPTAAPAFARDLFDPDLPGSLTHFYREMSRGQFELTGACLPVWYTAAQPAAAYLNPGPRRGEYGRFAREILLAVDAAVDLGQYDNDGPDGIANSGDDDGTVDFVFINARSTPPGFIFGPATGVAGLGLPDGLTSSDPAAGGGYIRIRADADRRGMGGCVQRARGFAEAVGNMAHEFGHALGLVDLFDHDLEEEGELAPERDSAGIGCWGLMAHGAGGWDDHGGPNPFCAVDLEQLGWIGRNNECLVPVDGNRTDVVLADVNAGGQVYRLPTSQPEEYFLIENRQPDHSFYERYLPAGGLLIWHVTSSVTGNDAEEQKRVDLECADGLFLDAGYPLGKIPNAQAGFDNLDFWAHEAGYAAAHAGNQGDGTDPFDGVRFTEFTRYSNPSSRLTNGADSGISVSRIRRQGTTMVADLQLLGRRWAGPVRTALWEDTVEVVGDVLIPGGGRLQITPGCVVRFGPDQYRGGLDPDRCELVVEGELAVDYLGGETVVFTSAAPAPHPGDWYGIVVGPEGLVGLRRSVIEYAGTGISGEGLRRAQRLQDLTIRQCQADGIRLTGSSARLVLEEVQVEGTAGRGLAVSGPGVGWISGSRFTGHGRAGVEWTGGTLYCVDNEFSDNGDRGEDGANLILSTQVSAWVERNRFSGGPVGVRCDQSGETIVNDNWFGRQPVGVSSSSASPEILHNRFVDHELVLRLEGTVAPARIEWNAVDGADWLLENRTPVQVLAIHNWWGTEDEAWVSTHLSGPVLWQPFLRQTPEAPLAFTLARPYPNPFNGSAVIPYRLGVDGSGGAMAVPVVLEVRSALGILVRRLVDEVAATGDYQAVWDGTDQAGRPVGSGVYLCRLTAGPDHQIRRLLLLR
ncbi:MAG: right-handed parallel beta-helix repeat-containing protein [Candidatus Latescibacterota bacterium]